MTTNINLEQAFTENFVSKHKKPSNMSSYDVDAYLEYTRIVGDDDSGKLMTPSEYEEYKKKVLPNRIKNRLYVSWTNSENMDCKLIGPETQCFCGHRYRNHQTHFDTIPKERPIKLKCKQKSCKCESYFYVPMNGGQPIRCSCKHFSTDHSANGLRKCTKDCKCQGFKSSYPCGCMEQFNKHKTVVQTKEERLAEGKPVGHDVPYQAMGGITGFSSLIDGYMRLDPSGRGAPSDEMLNKSVTSSDHAFLKMHAPSTRSRSMEPRKDRRSLTMTKNQL